MLLLIAAGEPPSDFAFHQNLGMQVPLDVELRDDSGREAPLREFIGGTPAILALGYFQCPNLCGTVRADMLSALAASGLRAPEDYTLLPVSVDPSETSVDARAARQTDISRFDLHGAEQAWHYLTGKANSLAQIEAAVGFRARFDPALKQFLHPAGLVLLTSSGVVSGYLLGVGYSPGDLSAAVVRARDGRVARTASPILLLCFHFDPVTGRYTLAVTRVLEFASALTVLGLGTMLGLAFRRERRSR
ncbi:MAG: SCO family protein [Acetobacteraceae bacterium]|nr:SCO family protein [Acetobacteraceae bacterium]